MADPRFHQRSDPKTLKELADIAGAELVDTGAADQVITDVGTLDSAGPDEISFLDNIRYKEGFFQSKAGACIVSKSFADKELDGGKAANLPLLLSASPYKSYALIAQAFYPKDAKAAYISDKAYVDPESDIGEGCHIAAGVYVGKGACIGNGTYIEPNSVIQNNVSIGQNCHIGSNATITHALIGDGVTIYAGVRIGQDGFGFAIDPAGHVKVPQLGRVIIEDRVEIGANTTIDRGAGPDTIIGQGTWIDNLVQIAHNVQIGRGCVLVAQSGIAGSSVMEDYSVIAAQAGVAGHLKVGTGARIGAKAGVMRNVPAGSEQLGSPAIPAREFMKQVASLKRLTKQSKH